MKSTTSYCILAAVLFCLCVSNTEAFGRKAKKLNPELEAKFDVLTAWIAYRLNLKHAKEACIGEYGFTDELATSLVKVQVASPSDREKCYVNCLYTKLVFYNNNQINTQAMKESLIEIVGEERLLQIVNSCLNAGGTNDCDKVYKFHACASPEFDKVRGDIFQPDE
ncbi:PREDICTED: general odorant-binding protein 56a-like [Rhagoletis zephyria]|uniref:general odorant-binding protein 56a-like n=1 Tax=Rhagoletis zephyria TaxID=28612 RepID=UPI0008115E5C|nr:PREDICTED: general odorant-binding protein 56a-like [Rhagoletis zephyria]